MSKKKMLNIALSDLVEATQQVAELAEKVRNLEESIFKLEAVNDDVFDPIEVASKKLNKSVSAIRQRLKHPQKPMRKGHVWKQEDKGCAIFVNVKRFREQM